jgi:hypothetical protein
MGILTLYGAKKHMENSHMISIIIHGIFPSIEKEKTQNNRGILKLIHGNILNTSLKE